MQNHVLFICAHNSARSQIAEELMRLYHGDTVRAESAGLREGLHINPLAIEVLPEIGIDISDKETQDAFELYRQGRLFSHVITVCDDSNGEHCPVFPGGVVRLHWSLHDPAAFEGTWDERLERTRQVRDEIHRRIEEWYAEYRKVQ
jgi:arsenate reductase